MKLSEWLGYVEVSDGYVEINNYDGHKIAEIADVHEGLTDAQRDRLAQIINNYIDHEELFEAALAAERKEK